MTLLLRFVAFCRQRFIGIPDITQSKAQRAMRIFIRRSENRNDIVFTFVRGKASEGDILSPAVREQLRSLRVNRGKKFSDQREIYR